ncbi:unnamed protein product [Larinioides sclopetarius]|uniref:Uncharacterized protein n=1 Tax=Larinioides sclopetarius TaxID=280406 RepID=A0AAV1YR48_9ARAC
MRQGGGGQLGWEQLSHPHLTDGIVHDPQDGAPPHFSLSVRKALNGKFPDSWIGSEGPIPWPARSPDLTPIDFFWGYIKNFVYSETFRSVDGLVEPLVGFETAFRNEWGSVGGNEGMWGIEGLR